jgi:hypothetical protein
MDTIVLNNALVESFLNELVILKLGLITKINILEIGKHASDIISKLEYNQYVKDYIVDKLEFRMNQSLSRKDNVLFSFYNAVLKNKSFIVPSTIKENVNPITNAIVDCHLNMACNDSDRLSYTIFNDNYFMLKLLQAPLIICSFDYDTKPKEVLQEIKNAIINIGKQFDKKCILMMSSASKAPFFNDIDCHKYTFVRDIHRFLPRISQWCLVITDEIDTSANHGLARDDKSNIVWRLDTQNIWSSDVSYNRVLSLEPKTNEYTLYNTPTFWKAHTKFSCPRLSPVYAVNNHLLYIDFMYSYASKKKAEIEHALKKQRKPKGEHVIFLVDNRENDMSVLSAKFAIMNTMQKEPTHPQWDVYIFTSSKAVQYYSKELPIATVVAHPLLENKFDIDVYNDILEDPKLWKNFEGKYEYALVIQDDGVLFRQGVNDFLKYDYVGAPWADIEDNIFIKEHIAPNMVGNGGCSLRNIKKMINICEKYKHRTCELFYSNINRIPEDVFFVKYLTLENAKFPTTQEASFFSMEQIINTKCLSFHKFWMYHPYYEVKQLFEHFLS